MPSRVIIAAAAAFGLAAPAAFAQLGPDAGPPMEARPGQCYASSGRDIQGVYRWEEVTCQGGLYINRRGGGAAYSDECWALVDRPGDGGFGWDRFDCRAQA